MALIMAFLDEPFNPFHTTVLFL